MLDPCDGTSAPAVDDPVAAANIDALSDAPLGPSADADDLLALNPPDLSANSAGVPPPPPASDAYHGHPANRSNAPGDVDG